MFSDVKFAARLLVTHPGFTIVATLVLAVVALRTELPRFRAHPLHESAAFWPDFPGIPYSESCK